MKFRQKNDGIFQGVFIAYLLLILHVVLLAFVGFLILFFRGVVTNMLWIILALALGVVGSGYLVYRRIKKQGGALGDTLNSPAFNGRPMEIRLLGGLASLRVGHPGQPFVIDAEHREIPKQLTESTAAPTISKPGNQPVEELYKLAALLKDGFLTEDEYRKMKSRIFENDRNEDRVKEI